MIGSFLAGRGRAVHLPAVRVHHGALGSAAEETGVPSGHQSPGSAWRTCSTPRSTGLLRRRTPGSWFAPVAKPAQLSNSPGRGDWTVHGGQGKLIMACGTGRTFTSHCRRNPVAGSCSRIALRQPCCRRRSWVGAESVPLRSASRSAVKVGRAQRTSLSRVGGGPGDPSHTDGAALADRLTCRTADQDGPDDGGLLHLPVDRRRRPGPSSAPPADLVICD